MHIVYNNFVCEDVWLQGRRKSLRPSQSWRSAEGGEEEAWLQYVWLAIELGSNIFTVLATCMQMQGLLYGIDLQAGSGM